MDVKVKRHTIKLCLALFLFLAAPATANAFPKAVERWRAPLRAELRRQKVWSASVEWRVLHIVEGESTGNPSAGSRRGCYGLLQFDRGWVYGYDWRGSGTTSIRTIVTLYRKYGLSPLKRHWAATYW